jgi:hypothetical protein
MAFGRDPEMLDAVAAADLGWRAFSGAVIADVAPGQETLWDA